MKEMEDVITWWVIPTITNDTIYFQKYCTDFTWWQCIESITILWIWKEELKQDWVEILTTCAVFILVVMILVWLVKWIFRLILPWKWRK